MIDSSMALFGPNWFRQIKVSFRIRMFEAIINYIITTQNDPWGSIKSMVPDAATNSGTQNDYLLPKVEDWSLISDDMTSFYEVR